MKSSLKELKIMSGQENWFLVEKFIEDICETFHITNRYYGNILLTIEEAVRNAMIHGNGNDPKKSVTISFKRKPIGLAFRIIDEGKGFNINGIPNPIESDKKTGNGLFLIRSLADSIRYNDKGNELEVVFNISSINQETTISRKRQLDNYFQKQTSNVKN